MSLHTRTPTHIYHGNHSFQNTTDNTVIVTTVKFLQTKINLELNELISIYL